MRIVASSQTSCVKGTVEKMRNDTARAVEPFVADAACNDKFGWEKSRELYQECVNIRPLIWAAEASEREAARDLSEPRRTWEVSRRTNYEKQTIH